MAYHPIRRTGLLPVERWEHACRSGKYLSVGEGGALRARDTGPAGPVADACRRAARAPGAIDEALHVARTWLRSALRGRPLWGLVGESMWSAYARSADVAAPVADRDEPHLRRQLTCSSRVHAWAACQKRWRDSARMRSGWRSIWATSLPRVLQTCAISGATAISIRCCVSTRAQRDRMVQVLHDRGIGTITPYKDNASLAAQHFGYAGDCPRAESVAQRVLVPPSGHGLGHSDLRRIAPPSTRPAASCAPRRPPCGPRCREGDRMIECIFTLDYEIYGNGSGDLATLVFEPTERLLALFRSRGNRFVRLRRGRRAEPPSRPRGPTGDLVGERQVRRGPWQRFEIALHLHPQGATRPGADGAGGSTTANTTSARWTERGCVEIVDRAIEYLRRTVADPATPTSFRAGNWLFQPTAVLARVLADRGIKMDSSVYKGGLQRQLGLDYRKAVGNGYAWRFREQVDIPTRRHPARDSHLHRAGSALGHGHAQAARLRAQRQRPRRRLGGRRGSRLRKAMDLARWRYPLKLDFCRMTRHELLRTIDRVMRADAADPTTFRPIVAIGHAKDLVDLDTVERFLDTLLERGIPVSTLQDVYPKCAAAPPPRAVSAAMASSTEHARDGHAIVTIRPNLRVHLHLSASAAAATPARRTAAAADGRTVRAFRGGGR